MSLKAKHAAALQGSHWQTLPPPLIRVILIILFNSFVSKVHSIYAGPKSGVSIISKN